MENTSKLQGVSIKFLGSEIDSSPLTSEERAIRRIILRTQAVQADRRNSVMSKVNRYRLEEFVFKKYYVERYTISETARECTKELKRRGTNDVMITPLNVITWLDRLKRKILKERPSDLSSKVTKALKLLDDSTSLLESFKDALDDYIESGALYNEDLLNSVMKIFAMWDRTSINLAKLLESGLPHPPINVETLKQNLVNVLNVVMDSGYLDNEQKQRLIHDIKARVIDNVTFVIGEENDLPAYSGTTVPEELSEE